MAGWNLKAGTITKYDVSEDETWSLFNSQNQLVSPNSLNLLLAY